MNLPGYFITFEGGEGAGKTTALYAIAPVLVDKGYPILVTREPGNTDIGDQLRDVVHKIENTGMVGMTEALIYQASRAQNVYENVRPHLVKGGIVLQDRFTDSSLAYQGYARALGSVVDELNKISTGGLVPDLTFFFDVDPEIGIRRRRSSSFLGEEWNRIDAEVSKFHKNVHEAYRVLHAYDIADRWVRIDASKEKEEIASEVLQIIEYKLEKHWSPEGNITSAERRG